MREVVTVVFKTTDGKTLRAPRDWSPDDRFAISTEFYYALILAAAQILVENGADVETLILDDIILPGIQRRYAMRARLSGITSPDVMQDGFIFATNDEDAQIQIRMAVVQSSDYLTGKGGNGPLISELPVFLSRMKAVKIISFARAPFPISSLSEVCADFREKLMTRSFSDAELRAKIRQIGIKTLDALT